jgi:hypothetical protein
MAAFVKIYSFVEDLAEKIHNIGADALTVALTANATPPVQTNTVLANLTQIAYTNLSTRAIAMGSATSAQTTGTYKLTLPDLVLTQSTTTSATFRWVVIYNATPGAGNLICYFDYGADVTLAPGETFTLDFDGTNGLLQIV